LALQGHGEQKGKLFSTSYLVMPKDSSERKFDVVAMTTISTLVRL
jgi:hypothetical protein